VEDGDSEQRALGYKPNTDRLVSYLKCCTVFPLKEGKCLYLKQSKEKLRKTCCYLEYKTAKMPNTLFRRKWEFSAFSLFFRIWPSQIHKRKNYSRDYYRSL